MSGQMRRRWPVGVGLAASAAALLVSLLGACGTSSNEASATSTTLSLAQRTGQLAQVLDLELCDYAEDCVDGSTPGVLVVDGGKYSNQFTTDELQRAGEKSGLWGPADVARMGETRALDGTQTSRDGTVSWTYHPDSGLDIVIEIEG